MPTSFRGTRVSLGKTQMMAWGTFSGLGQAFVCQGTDLAIFSSEMGDEAFLVAGAMDCLGLSVWAGDFHRLVVFIELDSKVGQI